MDKYNSLRFKKRFMIFLVLMLLTAITINLSSCSFVAPLKVQANDLMEGINSNAVGGKKTDSEFIDNSADFIVKLFKKSADKEKNSLVSPISVMLALAMTANGADGETLTEMERVLGGDISLDDLNEYLYYYANDLPNKKRSKLKIANSIWFRDNEGYLTVDQDFLQKNGDYYNAQAYKSPFTEQTVLDINNWVKKSTDGMIDKILKEIDGNTIMYLINAVVFDAEWKTGYKKNDIYKNEFTAISGEKRYIDFMRSKENLYLEDDRTTGFIKHYYDGHYSFVAFLPNPEIDIKDYIVGLTGKDLLDMISKAETTDVNVSMPKFTYEYEIELNDILKDLGMSLCFNDDKADFTRLGKSSRGNIYIDKVLHKTFISLDEQGTRAGAITKFGMASKSAPVFSKSVILDRPFVYAVIDNSTNLPVFIGSIIDL